MPEATLLVALVGGLILLAIAGEVLVNGAVALGRKAGVSPLIAGIFIVGFGTSAPEMVVAADAAGMGYPNLALGNIVGSNIANILLVLSIPALIFPVTAGGWGQRRAFFAMLLATAIWIAALATDRLNASLGIVFLLGLILYGVYTLISARAAVKAGQDIGIETEAPSMPTWRAIGCVLVGIIGLPIGGNLIVESGVEIAKFYGISDELIGLTLLAVGTSLPEIAAGISAARQHKTDVLIGNVLGSNLFNILGAGGIITFFSQIKAADSFAQYDHWVMAAAALLVGIFIFTRASISRLAGVTLLLLYAMYIYGLIHNWNILGAIHG